MLIKSFYHAADFESSKQSKIHLKKKCLPKTHGGKPKITRTNNFSPTAGKSPLHTHSIANLFGGLWKLKITEKRRQYDGTCVIDVYWWKSTTKTSIARWQLEELYSMLQTSGIKPANSTEQYWWEVSFNGDCRTPNPWWKSTTKTPTSRRGHEKLCSMLQAS